MRFNAAAANTLTLSGNNTITSGGILVTPAVGANATTLTGGTLLGASGKDLVVIQNNTSGALTVGSVIADNGGATGLTKSGSGTLALTAANTYAGGTTIANGAAFTCVIGMKFLIGSNPGELYSVGFTAISDTWPVSRV